MSDKKAQIKETIRQLHAGVLLEEVKEKFRDVFEGTDTSQIAKIEEELVKEKMCAGYAMFIWQFLRNRLRSKTSTSSPASLSRKTL